MTAEKQKLCIRCRDVKNISNFYFVKLKQKFENTCRQCRSKDMAATKKILKKERRNLVKNLKESTACYVCNKFYPYYVCDLDHQLGYTKIDSINKLIANRASIKNLKFELSKCKVICANCHRKISFDKFKRNIKKEWYFSLKEKPCADCTVSYPYYVMDFDHKEEKQFNISSSKNKKLENRSKLLGEISKCDLVCANCHRVRTQKRRKHAQ